jgi:hypothetical protein
MTMPKAGGEPPSQLLEYRDAIVTYLDILGFRQLVQNRPAFELAAILRTLGQHAKPDANVAQLYEMSTVNFSDLTLRIVPLTSEATRLSQLACCSTRF